MDRGQEKRSLPGMEEGSAVVPRQETGPCVLIERGKPLYSGGQGSQCGKRLGGGPVVRSLYSTGGVA